MTSASLVILRYSPWVATINIKFYDGAIKQDTYVHKVRITYNGKARESKHHILKDKSLKRNVTA